MPRHKPVPASACSLDYKACTLVELRKFILDRLIIRPSEEELRKINNCNLNQLTNRLHKLDQKREFPRFMELPPELRVNVYEWLLVDAQDRNEHGNVDSSFERNRFKLHPAVLRTSKQIYSEAQPILYKQNKFGASVTYFEEGTDGPWGTTMGCLLKVVQSGRRLSFRQDLEGPSDTHSPYLRGLFKDSAMSMLRMLTHLTVDLSLVTPGEDESHVYVSKACNAIASLCLSLTGASKMEELTIKVEAGHPQRDHVDLARILGPLMLLRTDIVVKFEGIAEVPVTFMTHLGMIPQAEAYYGRIIAGIRKRCNKEIGKQGWDITGLHFVEMVVKDLHHFGDMMISIDDIVNLSKTWKGMRTQADLAEAR